MDHRGRPLAAPGGFAGRNAAVLGIRGYSGCVAQADQTRAQLLDSTIQIPDNVVFREFAQETVLLDIESGQYFGLNPTAGRMLAVLQEAQTVRDAAVTLTEDFPDAGDVLESDLCNLCVALSKRNLIVLSPA